MKTSPYCTSQYAYDFSLYSSIDYKAVINASTPKLTFKTEKVNWDNETTDKITVHAELSNALGNVAWPTYFSAFITLQNSSSPANDLKSANTTPSNLVYYLTYFNNENSTNPYFPLSLIFNYNQVKTFCLKDTLVSIDQASYNCEFRLYFFDICHSLIFDVGASNARILGGNVVEAGPTLIPESQLSVLWIVEKVVLSI